jgi:hypothetical protein
LATDGSARRRTPDGKTRRRHKCGEPGWRAVHRRLEAGRSAAVSFSFTRSCGRAASGPQRLTWSLTPHSPGHPGPLWPWWWFQDLLLSRTMISNRQVALRGSFRLRLASTCNHRPAEVHQPAYSGTGGPQDGSPTPSQHPGRHPSRRPAGSPPAATPAATGQRPPGRGRPPPTPDPAAEVVGGGRW